MPRSRLAGSASAPTSSTVSWDAWVGNRSRSISHFGWTAGYNFLHMKSTDTLVGREFKVRQSVHGPLVGIGLYFLRNIPSRPGSTWIRDDVEGASPHLAAR